MIIATSILVGTLSVGGTAYAVQKNHADKVNDAKAELKQETKTLNSIESEVSAYIDKDGFLQSGLTYDVIEQLKKSLNSIKDDYIDFSIKKDDLKNEIKVVKIGKESLEQDFADITSKLQTQVAVNALFTKDAIDGNEVKTQSIKDGLTEEEVAEVKTLLKEEIKDDSKWGIELGKLADEADNQIKQIETATKAVNGLYSNDKVKDDVTVSQYKKAKSEVDKVKNENAKKDLEKKLDKVSTVAQANEKKAKEEAEAQAKAEAEAQAKAEAEAQAQATQTANTSTSNSNSSSNGTTSNYSSSSNSGSSNSYSSNSGSSSSSNYSSGSTSKSSNSTSKSSGSSSSSKSTSSSSSSNKSSGSSSTSKSSGSSSSNSSSSGKITNVQKTGEGEIDYSGKGKNTGTGNTYEEWTFQMDE